MRMMESLDGSQARGVGRGEDHVLIRLSCLCAPLPLLNNALVVENDRFDSGSNAIAFVVVVVMIGVVRETGIRKTLTREANTGDNDRIFQRTESEGSTTQ
jgi:hypothetical protein